MRGELGLSVLLFDSCWGWSLRLSLRGSAVALEKGAEECVCVCVCVLSCESQ